MGYGAYRLPADMDYEALARAAIGYIQKELGMSDPAFADALKKEMRGRGPHPQTVTHWRSGRIKDPGFSYALAAAHLLNQRRGLTLDEVVRRVEGTDAAIIEIVDTLVKRVQALEHRMSDPSQGDGGESST